MGAGLLRPAPDFLMTIVATKPLYNPREYGHISAGAAFTVADRIARNLIERGYAVPLVYETKVVTAARAPVYDVKEGTTAAPFRDLPAADAQPPALAAVRAAVRAVSDVPPAGDSGGLKRRKNRGSA